MSEIHVTGLADLQKFLDTLPAKVAANVMRGALRAGAKVIEADARAKCPSAPSGFRFFGLRSQGLLRDSIRVSTRIKGTTISSSIKAGGKWKGVNIFWVNFVEWGTNAHLISVQESEKNTNLRRSVKLGMMVKESMTTINRRVLQIGNTFIGPTVSHPGSKPHPFMRPALDSQAQNAVVAVAEYMKKRLATKEGLDTSGVMIEGDT